MKAEMLWTFDDSVKTLEEQVKVAADYFARKYGVLPGRVAVNPADMGEGAVAGDVKTVETVLTGYGTKVVTIRVEAMRSVRKDYLFMVGASEGVVR
jgi:hypothetical protein